MEKFLKIVLSMYHAGLKAQSVLGDRVRDESASDEEIEAYNELKTSLASLEKENPKLFR